MSTGRSDELLEAIELYQRALGVGDSREMAAARARVLELSFAEVSQTAAVRFASATVDADCAASAGLEAFVRHVDKYLANYDPARGNLFGYALGKSSTWDRETRRLLRSDTVGNTGLSASQDNIVRLFHVFQEEYTREHGHAPTREQSTTHLYQSQVDRAAERIRDANPDLDETEVLAKAERRVSQDGHRAALKTNLDDLLLTQQAMRPVSADALLGESGTDGWDLIAAPVAAEHDVSCGDAGADTLDELMRLATLDMDGRTRRRAVRAMSSSALEDQPLADRELAKVARSRMLDPVAQFVVLGGIESQFEVLAGSLVSEERELLLAAASL